MVTYYVDKSDHGLFQGDILAFLVDGLSKTIGNGRIVVISAEIQVRDLQCVKQKGRSP